MRGKMTGLVGELEQAGPGPLLFQGQPAHHRQKGWAVQASFLSMLLSPALCHREVFWKGTLALAPATMTQTGLVLCSALGVPMSFGR